MEALWAILGVVLGLILGMAIGWLAGAARGQRALREEASRAQEEREARVAAETRLEEMQKQFEGQRALLEEVRGSLADTFRALSAEVLQANSQAFIDRAKQTLEPVQEALRRYEDHLRELEQSRQRAYGSLTEQLKTITEREEQLRRETANLVSALRQPQVRGRWGELTLRRCVELAGMVNHVDYVEQVTAETEAGRLRPDMIVHLPNGRCVVVDAKVSLEAYLSAVEATDEETRRRHLLQHCQQIRQHVRELGQKAYWEQFEQTADFVLMFVPLEACLHAACDSDPELIEYALEQRVMLASPTILVAVLRAIERGWREEQLAQSAHQVSQLGRDLYERIRGFVDNMAKLGDHLRRATEVYNQAVGSLESRVLPAARRFKELGAAGAKEIATLEAFDVRPRELTGPEAREGAQ